MRVYWFESWHGIDADGRECNIGVTASCDHIDAINRQRKAVKDAGQDPNDFTDDELLADFITVNWAMLSAKDKPSDGNQPTTTGDS